MSELAKKLFDGLKAAGNAVQAVAPGLENLAGDVKAEMSRMATQGATEIASALFQGSSAWVPYGQGQLRPEPERQPEREPETEREGMER